MISQQAMKSLKEWTPVSKRIMTARFYSRCRRVSVIQAYAPNNEEEEKDKFYQELQETLDGCNKNEIIIIMGDLNAKVGGRSEIMDMKELWVSMDWEHRMKMEKDCEFSQTNGLVITGTLFPHKDIHKATWVSATGTARNPIDHLLISGQWRSSVLDTKVQRGANANNNHYLVKTRIRLRLSTHKNKNKLKPRLDVEVRTPQKQRSKSKVQFPWEKGVRRAHGKDGRYRENLGTAEDGICECSRGSTWLQERQK
ncbi:craniofacial development protein 2-like [Saccostrea cucullata]|uniref:craniofacial development protein 2-like n=1 Tax=Saccostrea cuccullata TaxID=36930 RepID=UPI002ED42565